MVKKLYMIWGSPPVNAIIIAAKALNVKLELCEVNFEKNELLEDWFLKINPTHTVPTLDDEGFIIWDSHAILIYLVEMYDKKLKFYSSEPREKFKILQILNFECGTVFRKISDCVRPIFYENAKSIDEKHLKNAEDVYKILERILKENQYLAGNKLTIADISVYATIAIANIFLPVEYTRWPNLNKWFLNFESLEISHVAQKGIEIFKTGLKIKLNL